MFKGLLFWLNRVRWCVETAFRSLEEFRVRTRTCDVGKELVLVLLSLGYLVWFVLWRRVKLWEFCESLVESLVLMEVEEGRATVSPQAKELSFVNLS